MSVQRDVRRNGIWIHRVTRFGPGEVGEIDDIPCTSPARTILDLSGRLDEGELEAIVAEAHTQDRRITAQLEGLLARHRRRRGIAALRELVESGREPQRTRSRPERRLLARIRKRGLPDPAANQMVGGHEVDLLWLDGWASPG